MQRKREDKACVVLTDYLSAHPHTRLPAYPPTHLPAHPHAHPPAHPPTHFSSYEEVAKPLEAYVIVFVIFFAPAAVMSSDWCEEHSGADLHLINMPGSSSATYTFGVCFSWCELILAFRSVSPMHTVTSIQDCLFVCLFVHGPHANFDSDPAIACLWSLNLSVPGMTGLFTSLKQLQSTRMQRKHSCMYSRLLNAIYFCT
jgi:hypothetical protein